MTLGDVWSASVAIPVRSLLDEHAQQTNDKFGALSWIKGRFGATGGDVRENGFRVVNLFNFLAVCLQIELLATGI